MVDAAAQEEAGEGLAGAQPAHRVVALGGQQGQHRRAAVELLVVGGLVGDPLRRVLDRDLRGQGGAGRRPGDAEDPQALRPLIDLWATYAGDGPVPAPDTLPPPR